MARSHKDDHLSEMQQRWRFAPGENTGSNLTPTTNFSTRVNGNANELYDTNSGFNVYGNPVMNHLNKEATFGENSITNNSSFSNGSRNSIVNIGGQYVKVFYDDKNQPQYMIPVGNMNSQYELFHAKQGDPSHGSMAGSVYHHEPIDLSKHSSEYNRDSSSPMEPRVFNRAPERDAAPTNQHFIDGLLRMIKPNVSGTYSPFGPTNAQQDSIHFQDVADSAKIISNNTLLKRNDNGPLNDGGAKKRIVAEVKPMRPTYSDILSKNCKINQASDSTKKIKSPIISEQVKVKSNTQIKLEKQQSNPKIISDDFKPKNDKTKSSHISSGSDSGDIHNDHEKTKKIEKKPKNKAPKMSRKWSSLDNINGDTNDFQRPQSQFEYIDNSSKQTDEFDDFGDDFDESRDGFVFQETPIETKIKRRPKENRAKATKTNSEKKKQVKLKKKGGAGYFGIVQNHVENWRTVTVKAFAWFYYLLSDICHMSAHLSWDLLSSVVTQTYMSFQAVWRSGKSWFIKLKENRFLMFIDRKLGHTKVGFWRKLKWFKGKDSKDESDPNVATVNIPLPATGEEAMKRLLACKGKDPYSILGVSPKCSDEEIKRYYRRQAFLVHPDKNQQPGAEEAFKILQHAFDLIGEPEVREAYDRDRLESKYKEAAWSELSDLLAQLHEKMEYAANTIRCTNCGRRHKRVLTDRPCYAARFCAQCKIRHSAKEGDIWAESGTFGLMVMYYACMDGGVYQITQWASCQKKNLKQLRPDSHAVQYRIVLGNKAAPAAAQPRAHDPNLEEFLNNLYTAGGGATAGPTEPPNATRETRTRKPKTRRNKV